jgi:hypothetical protein
MTTLIKTKKDIFLKYERILSRSDVESSMKKVTSSKIKCANVRVTYEDDVSCTGIYDSLFVLCPPFSILGLAL